MSIKKEIICDDAIHWMQNNSIPDNFAVLTSLPDISEFSHNSISKWKEWFIETAKLVLSKTPENNVTIFYQTDIKFEGTWVDKAYLCQKAAEELGHELLWHKIFCRMKPGLISFGRPAYSHVLCFSKQLKITQLNRSSADVVPDMGEKSWERGMGILACKSIAQFLLEQTPADSLFQPFCGEAGMLAVAQKMGLSGLGIERSPKRAKFARELVVDLTNQTFKKR